MDLAVEDDIICYDPNKADPKNKFGKGFLLGMIIESCMKKADGNYRQHPMSKALETIYKWDKKRNNQVKGHKIPAFTGLNQQTTGICAAHQ